MQLPAVLSRIEAEHVETPTVRDPQTGEAFHRRRLARAVAPQNAEDFSGSDRKAHIIHCHGRPIGLVQMLDRDNRGSVLGEYLTHRRLPRLAIFRQWEVALSWAST